MLLWRTDWSIITIVKKVVIIMTINQRIKLLREEKGLTQEELAESISVNRSTLASWERNISPMMKECKKLAAFFDVSLDYLAGESDQRQEAPAEVPVMVFTQSDVTLIQRFHAMSSIGQKMVLDMIDSIEKMEKMK
jgi:transcriptional regulator with XRE-family HTH domain